jgi:hypothetical protein
MKAHGTEPRGYRPPPLSRLHEGRFGRLFRNLEPAPALPPADRKALADSMRDPDPPGGDGDNPGIPAGYTYFGQFVDHDITFDPESSLQQQNDPDALVDFRTPRFDLDSVYGSGPEDEPFQYDRDEPETFLIGNSKGQADLPRNEQGTALIGDPRNDENIIVRGLQLVFLQLHNKLYSQVAADDAIPPERRFLETQQRVRWHYQWVVVDDFLRLLVGDELLTQLFHLDAAGGKPEFELDYYTPKKNPYMPVEFSVAAFRFGHSQVRPAYDLNETVTDKPIFEPGDEVGEFGDLRGFRALPDWWTVDWRLFLPIDGSAPQPSRRIDARLSGGLFDLPNVPPDQPQSLPERNLLRGESFGLPSGQDVAKRLCVTPLTGQQLEAPEPTPLWFYILKESELEGGTKLGPVGARIVAEVLLGLLELDPKAWVNVDPTWRPTIPAANPPAFTLGDLVKFATA